MRLTAKQRAPLLQIAISAEEAAIAWNDKHPDKKPDGSFCLWAIETAFKRIEKFKKMEAQLKKERGK